MNAWLKCSLETGMFPSEYAVEIDTLEGGRVSLFAPDYKVDADNSLLGVEVLSETNHVSLVRLPSYPFEISSRMVRVSRNEVLR